MAALDLVKMVYKKIRRRFLLRRIRKQGSEVLSPSIYCVKYIAHSLPAVLPPLGSFEGFVVVENCGNRIWRKNPAEGNAVDLLAYIDGSLAGTSHLSQTEVYQGEQVKFSLCFRGPEKAGTHMLKLALVEQNVTFFEDLGVEPLIFEFEVSPLSNQAALGTGRQARRIPSLPPYGVRYVECGIPQQVPASAYFGAWVGIENRGRLIWKNTHPDGLQIYLGIFIDGQLVSSQHLPVPAVRSLEQVIIHFSIPAPEETGVYDLKIDLIQYGATLGVSPLRTTLVVGKETLMESDQLYRTALSRNSWFYSPTRGISRSRDGRGFPVFISKAKGCHIWDVAGRKYIDYTMGWGSALLGYAHPRIQKAIMAALENGAVLPFPHRLVVEVSQMLCADIPCAEMVAFGKNGSDVCTLAVRLARLYTGRTKVLFCGYHGWQDWFGEIYGFQSSGIPDRPEKLVYQFKFNDDADFRAKFETHRDDLAAVMIEPSGPAEDIQGPVRDADSRFLKSISRNTRKAGALLIFDEIITGFRYPQSSVQRALGVIPDLACFGKALGAGMPISALVGKKEIFSAVMSRSFYGPTFKDETYSLSAAREALSIYRTEPVADHVLNFGSQLKAEGNRICSLLGLPAEMVGPPFRFTLAFREKNPIRLAQFRTLYMQEMLKCGIVTYNGIMLPSYAHDRDAFAQTIEAVDTVLRIVNRALQEDAFQRYIEIPLI